MKSNWKKYTFDDICTRIYSGGTPSTKKSEYWNGSINWLSSGETKNKYIHKTERKITEFGVTHSSTQKAHVGDTVVASAGQGYTRGQASYLTIDTYINQSVIVFNANSKIVDKKFLYFNLDNRYDELRQLSDGTSTRGGLSCWIVKKMEINLPPLETQKKIASILSALDDKIELNNKINENLEMQAQAIFKSWFVDFEPFGGVMPEDWKMGTVKDIVELHDSKRIPLSGSEREKMDKIYPYYGATSCMDYVDNYIFDGIYLLLGEDGTVVDTKGFPILQYVEGKFWVNNHAHILTGKLGYTVETLYLLFKQTNVTHIVTGAVQPKISQANLKKLPAIIPNIKELDNFNTIIQPIFSMIRKNKNENQRLAELRDTLLPKLMNGEIDVDDVQVKE